MSSKYTFKEILKAFAEADLSGAFKRAVQPLTDLLTSKRLDDALTNTEEDPDKVIDVLEHNTRIQMESFISICDIIVVPNGAAPTYYAEQYLRLLSHNKFHKVHGILDEQTLTHVFFLLYRGESFKNHALNVKSVLAELDERNERSPLYTRKGYTSLVLELDKVATRRIAEIK